MGVRPPSNDIDDEPTMIEFGIAALEAHVDESAVSFPTTSEALVEAYPELSISVDASGHEIDLDDALERCERTEFQSKQQLLNALHPIFEEERERRGGTIVGRLRSLVPF